MKQKKGLWIYILAVLLVVVLWYSSTERHTSNVSYSKFQDDVTKDHATSIEIDQNAEVPTGRVNYRTDGKDTVVRTLYVSDVNKVTEYLDNKHKTYTVRLPSCE